jgi:hypothetical protein
MLLIEYPKTIRYLTAQLTDALHHLHRTPSLHGLIDHLVRVQGQLRFANQFVGSNDVLIPKLDLMWNGCGVP